MIKFTEISTITAAKVIGNTQDGLIGNLYIDSRKIHHVENDIFVALSGNIQDGHLYLENCYEQGIRNFIVSQKPKIAHPDATYFVVNDSIVAIQLLAKEKLSRSNLKHKFVITGSNGKTIVKEWLSDLLQSNFNIVKSPKSYNSQIGVPLSVWQVTEYHELGIFEAGISMPGEMEVLSNILIGDIGIFTHLGDAHNTGFVNSEEKINEKIKVFKSCQTIIIDQSESETYSAINEKYPSKNILAWRIISEKLADDKSSTYVKVALLDQEYYFSIPFTDKASIQNAVNCAVAMLYLEIPYSEILRKIAHIVPVKLRLEQINGIYNSVIINDSYNADLSSLQNALEFLQLRNFQQSKVLVLSDFEEVFNDKEEFLKSIALLINNAAITECIGIGKQIKGLGKYLIDKQFRSFESVNKFIQNFEPDYIYEKVVLVKGARHFKFEQIVDFLSATKNSVTLETNLQAIAHNISYYGAKVGNHTKIMGVIKAAGYGSGAEVMGKFLEYKRIDFLAVANVDEGIALRKADVTLPIVILNPSIGDFVHLVKYKLEPEVYDIAQLKELSYLLKKQVNNKLSIHLKLDTGMHRLGFMEDDMDEVISICKKTKNLILASIFTHLSSSDNPDFDDYTLMQLDKYENWYQKIAKEIKQKPLRHALNTAGVERFPQYAFDIVRLGLGLYGINETLVNQEKLELAHTLTATVIQTKALKKGQFVGYNKAGIMPHDGKIAMINIGYADGLLRASGNGKHSFVIKGKKAPIIGNVCMDITMVDISNIPDVTIGEKAIVFGSEGGIFNLSKINDTIPYEVISRIAERVNRTYLD